MSLRLRLTLLSLVALVLGLLAGGIVVPVLVQRFMTDRLDEDLLRLAGPALRSVDRPPPGGTPDSPVGARPVYVELRAPDGTVELGYFLDGTDVAKKPDLPDELLPHLGKPFTTSAHDARHYRVLVLTTRFGPKYTFAVALPMTEVDATVRRVIRIEAVTITLAVVGVGLLAWWLIGLGLRPLRRMEETAASIAETGEPGHGQRIEHPSERTEIGRLGTTLNTMFDRIDESFTAQRATEARLRHFAADASHELRTPLTSIRGYAELYRRGGDEPKQVERSMGRIEAEAARMSALVEDLLTITRLDEGRPLDRRPVDLSDLAAKAVADAQVVDPDRPITLDAPSPVTIDGDPNRLMQVIINLVGNAQVHTPAGTTIAVRARRNGTSAVLEVEDHGPGLTPEQAAQVFDRFYRADPSRSRAQGGSGLGLAIVDAVVRAHGGTPSVHTTPGGGATFRVELPVSGTDGTDVDVASSKEHGST